MPDFMWFFSTLKEFSSCHRIESIESRMKYGPKLKKKTRVKKVVRRSDRKGKAGLFVWPL
jgi:hypothetical protein